MTAYSIYRVSDGEIVQTGSTPQIESMRAAMPDGMELLDKYVNPKTHRISKNGRAIKRRRSDIEKKEIDAAWKKIRNEREQRLASSDWTQMPDAPVDQEAWRQYRQALRDLPANTTDPRNPDWPEPPK